MSMSLVQMPSTRIQISDPIFLRFNVKKGSKLKFDERNQGVFVKTNEGGEAPSVKNNENFWGCSLQGTSLFWVFRFVRSAGFVQAEISAFGHPLCHLNMAASPAGGIINASRPPQGCPVGRSSLD